jgi:hypothetical protein
MQTEDKIKTNCNQNNHTSIVPIPARVTALLTGVSESYVKKIRIGNREDHSEKAQAVRLCDSLLTEGSGVLLKEVQRVLDTLKDKIQPNIKN